MNKLVAAAGLLLATASASAEVVTYYGGSFHGRKTASGERFNQYAMTCASNTHAFGTRLKVTNVKNGKSVICRVNDRGGFSKHGIALDLSKGAFAKIAPLSQGRATVRIERVDAASSTLASSETAAVQNQQDQQVAEALAKITPLTITQTTYVIGKSMQPNPPMDQDGLGGALNHLPTNPSAQ